MSSCSFHGYTVTSALGASAARSIAAWYECAGVSSGITSSGVWHDAAKSRDTQYMKSGCTRYRLCRYRSITSIVTSGRCSISAGAQPSMPPLYIASGVASACPTGWHSTAASTRSGARSISFIANGPPMQ